jgi:glucose/arabinose dehydrogenase
MGLEQRTYNAGWVVNVMVCGLILMVSFFSSCQNRTSEAEQRIFSQEDLFRKRLESSQLVVSVVASGLDVPWDLCWVGDTDGKIWFTEIKGTVNQLDLTSGEITTILELNDVLVKKSYGLLGFAVHPDLESYPYVFLHYTYLDNESINSRLVRYTYLDDKLVSPLVLMEKIPGNTYHNGSRIVISEDNKVFLSIGDTGRKRFAQNLDNVVGKVLRVNMDGSVPDDNPIKGNPAWSWGHRNIQGLVFVDSTLFSSEHGEANDDEINIIEPGFNYGWPDVTGTCDLPYEQQICKDSLMQEPIKTWTPTIAPSGIDYYESKNIPELYSSILVTSLKDMSLRVLKLDKGKRQVRSEQVLFMRQFGRLRDVVVSPSGDIYLCTSNRDWHPKSNPEFYDDMDFSDHGDRIIRIHKAGNDLEKSLPEEVQKSLPESLKNLASKEDGNTNGVVLYEKYCTVCHKSDGSGNQSMFPPITSSTTVADKGKLIDIMLNGLSGPITVKGNEYNQDMPSFRFLTDDEIADLLTYVRRSFGNQRSPIKVDEVGALRRNSNLN